MRKVTGNATVRRGRVKLDLPPLIDNGNSVPLSVTVESPMTPADHVRAIHVFTEKNPQPYVISAASARVPAARTRHSRAHRRHRDGDRVAQMNDGSFWSDSVHVVVTLAACLEDGLI